jgi:hypothetical protein
MSREMTNFFVELSTNPLLMEKFQSDPEAILNESDLSAVEKQVVMTGRLEDVLTRVYANSLTGSGHGHGGKKKKQNGTKKKTVSKKKKSGKK